MMFSKKIKLASCLFFLIGSKIFAQYIFVDSNYNVQQLVDKFVGQTTCISVFNPQISGYDFGNGELSYGYFTKNTSDFEMDEGIALTSGIAANASGFFSGIQSASPGNWGGDQDLESAAQINNTTNATILEFDFISLESNKISFEYMFLSEQYLRFGDPGTCGFTDGFVFLIRKNNEQNYTNLAVIPGSNIPITSNNVRGEGGRCPASNPEFFGHYNPDGSPTNYNGQTKILTATTDVVVGQIYHIKLVIADQGNGLYDSGVFLKSGSFVGNKDLGADHLISSGNAICEGNSLVLDAFYPNSTYQWFKDGSILAGETSATYTVTQAGFYEVEINSAGCKLKGSITVEYDEEPLFEEKTFTFCDDDFDGEIEVKLQELNSQLVSNYAPHFEVLYVEYPIPPNAVPLPNDWSFTSDTTLFVQVTSGCSFDVGLVHFKIGDRIIINNPPDVEICDNDLDGIVEINLADYVSLFTTDPDVSPHYFNSQTDAENNISEILDPEIEISNTSTFYYRFESSALCPQIGSLTFIIKSPKKSTTLENKTVCPDETTILDAGSGFDFYLWNTGETTQSISAGVGNYWVDLGFNGCVYRQEVSVIAAEPPIIINVDVNGNTVTIFATGGTQPYQYSIDGVNYQSSNVFSNVSRGSHTAYVKSADGCFVAEKEFVIINLINVITPNGDGKNDVLDYSDLSIKNNVSLKIYNQYGTLIHESKNKNYIWNGKLSGKPVFTGTYWYILNWEEPDTGEQKSFSGWILVKNRN
ncbi:MAG: gliding motility-associated C-terminal domain-containing protein [Flavobacteriaceae bacterium]|jgi:gliding motility-associated-like protein|nr:gliding motility-associated C-terminal domain-containing protein [Flavobacteriaceae bacterium]